MFIAHIPVGLALARFVTKNRLTLPVISAATCGAIFPDFDLTRFYLFDNHQRHHHDYWTHIPGVWLLIIVGWFVLSRFLKKPFGKLPLVFFTAVLSHLILDSVSGAIEWFWPFSDRGFNLVTVPATHAKWYVSFLTHWTFALEIFISIVSFCVAFSPNGYKDTKDARASASQAETGGGA